MITKTYLWKRGYKKIGENHYKKTRGRGCEKKIVIILLFEYDSHFVDTAWAIERGSTNVTENISKRSELRGWERFAFGKS